MPTDDIQLAPEVKNIAEAALAADAAFAALAAHAATAAARFNDASEIASEAADHAATAAAYAVTWWATQQDAVFGWTMRMQKRAACPSISRPCGTVKTRWTKFGEPYRIVCTMIPVGRIGHSG